RHTRWPRDWSSDVCSSDLHGALYADLADLVAARDGIRGQVAKANPLLVDLAEEAENPPAPAELDEVVGRIKAAYARLDRYPDGRSEERRVGKEGRSRWRPV